MIEVKNGVSISEGTGVELLAEYEGITYNLLVSLMKSGCTEDQAAILLYHAHLKGCERGIEGKEK